MFALMQGLQKKLQGARALQVVGGWVGNLLYSSLSSQLARKPFPTQPVSTP